MALATLTPTAASERNPKSGYVYGATATLPVRANVAGASVRVGMPSDLPANSVITSAILTLQQVGAAAGSFTLTVQRHSAAWTMSKITWANRPGVTGAAATSGPQVAPQDGAQWSFDVTADVQGWVSGLLFNYGWRLTSGSGTNLNLRGSAASVGKPSLVITYLSPTDAPVGLSPTGNQAVSVAKPWLSFQTPPDTTAINVQIDADSLSPYDFDSGDVASSVGSYDSSTMAGWAGLVAGGASLYWRARTKSSIGYSPWSLWAQMRRVAKPVVAITSPGATSDDTTPPVVWTVTGGVQTAWQVLITNAAGALIADSGRTVGTDLTWTPPKAVATLGATATVEVRVWDNVDRVATTFDPVYANATLTFTAAGTASVSPATACTAVPNGFNPSVVITATRGAAPDSWTLYRNDGKGETVVATGLSPASAAFSYTDWTAEPNKAHTYRAAPFTSGTGTASGGPTATVIPTCIGMWLVDPTDASKIAVLWGDDAGSFDATELAVIHQPIQGPPIRRVAYRPPLSGSLAGELVDVGSVTADAQIAVLYDFKRNDRDLRLVLGDRNMLVRIGDLTINPTPDSDLDRHSQATLSWWQQDAPPWSST